MSLFYKSKLLCNYIYLIRYVIQKLGRYVQSIVLKFLSDQTISLRIINEKQGSTAGEIHSNSNENSLEQNNNCQKQNFLSYYGNNFV